MSREGLLLRKSKRKNHRRSHECSGDIVELTGTLLALLPRCTRAGTCINRTDSIRRSHLRISVTPYAPELSAERQTTLQGRHTSFDVGDTLGTE